MYTYYNPNPKGKSVGDCVVRAISKITGMTWDKAFAELCDVAYDEKDMPSSNQVWGEYLRQIGYRRYIVPDTCPDCYTVRDFCYEHPIGVYVLATGSHVVAVIDGSYYDSWDSGEEVPIYYWKEKRDAGIQ